MRRTSSPFTTIRSEGALLPPEVLTRIADTDKDLGGLSPTDYHLGESERLGEAISRSWNRLVGVWVSFAPSLEGFNANEPGTGATRERWLAPLFQELGFGRLQVAKARQIEGVDYPISHEWGQVPIHLVGAGVDLGHRSKGVAGAAKMSPHSLVQDYLNRAPNLWGIVSNGRELRILRDNVSLTRQAYLAFDLEAMFSGEAYADFALLWLVCHESRFEPQEDRLEGCWLERWTLAAQAQGTRALNTLREGVERAISTLGGGFLAHPANRALREALQNGKFATADYYRELLRLIYRLIFLFVAEDRALLHPEVTPEEARSRYHDFYSTTRLRQIAERLRGGPHPDLWRSLVFICSRLASDDGCPELGLPFLGSSLFSPQACPHLDQAELANRDLLGAIRALAFTEQRRVLRQIDYRNMGSEELGSIYEALLELHPEVHHESGTFELATAAGNERKTTGSYYTPTPLISALLDSALDPVLGEAATQPDPQAAILGLKILDPACGSGHFLVAAAHRIAKRLAAIRTDEPEPSPDSYRHALRDVIGRCIFGIDVNPMATELCKVSLWMEAVEPGKPLSFLDHHIVCGNSLLGTTPALLARGVPDEAFTALEGDEKEVVKSLKKRNKEERKGQATLFGEAAHPDLVATIAKQVAELEATPDDSPEALHAKQQAWEALEASDEAAHPKLLADAWCAAFVIDKTKDAPVLTQGVLELLERDPRGGDSKLHEAIRALADRYRFLHPYLAFPQVFHPPAESEESDNPDQGWSGGFDMVVGNPPWERVKIQEKEWFAARGRNDVATAPNAAARKQLILQIEATDPSMWAEWTAALRQSDGESHLLRRSGRFPLCGRGDVNTYAVFAELGAQTVAPSGRTGQILPLGIATDDTTKSFFSALVSADRVVSLFGFENEEHIFAEVHNAVKFCLLTSVGAAKRSPAPQFAFFLRRTADIGSLDRTFSLTSSDFALLNPNTRTCPTFRTRLDADLALRVYSRVPVLDDESAPDGNPWGVSLARLFDMALDSAAFKSDPHPENSSERDGGLRLLPLLEAKMIHQYNDRYGTYEGQTQAQANKGFLPQPTPQQLADPYFSTRPHYWVDAREVERRLERANWREKWLLGVRKTTRSTDARTVVACVAPAFAAADTLPVVCIDARHTRIAHCLLANLNSFAFDYITRQKLAAANLNHFIFKQLPAIPPDSYEDPAPWQREVSVSVSEWLLPRVLELTYTAWDLEAAARQIGWESPPFRWDPERRSLIRAELDAAFFHLYSLNRDDTEYVLDTFPIVRKNDEKKYGEYRTKRLILERFDAIAKAIEAGEPYETVLDPPPADRNVAHVSR